MKTQKRQRKFAGNGKKAPSGELTERILSCAREVHLLLGPGLLAMAYEEALAHEFSLKGIQFIRQKEVNLSYKAKSIGWHRVDFLVEDEVVVELKSVEKLHGIHEAQLVSYLHSLNKKAGVLINFNALRFADGVQSLAI
ncbi:MAG: GxxExxY protein [Planctomycetaceae bacterium]